jgi:carbamoyl-phosphate synthase small subunit
MTSLTSIKLRIIVGWALAQQVSLVQTRSACWARAQPTFIGVALIGNVMSKSPAILVLADGTVFEGYSVGAPGYGAGELVFNTAMTGYQEMLTDPSYCHQVIMFTAAHIGNTGCNLDDMESSKVWAAGVVMNDCAILHSNYRSEQAFPDWLKTRGVVAIAGIDTRALTRRLRDDGAIGACITTDIHQVSKAKSLAQSSSQLTGADLAKLVSRQTIERWHEGRGIWASASKPLQFHVVAYDFGVKDSILRILHDLGCYLTIVPAETAAAEVLSLNPQGIFLSNGPGDPKACTYAIEAIQTFLDKDIPLFGICLGFQLLGLACGAESLKMKFGHHGANHPVIETVGQQRVLITSQNHGFAIDEATLPDCLEVTHRSLFDNSLQGIRHKQKPAFGFQGHPEASPGPHDIEHIFKQFIDLMQGG